jgi:hypothetical protein
MKTALLVLFPLFLLNCSTVREPEPNFETLSDSERVFDTLSTSPEFRDTAILLCIDKDCLTVDRRGSKPSSRHRVTDEND